MSFSLLDDGANFSGGGSGYSRPATEVAQNKTEWAVA